MKLNSYSAVTDQGPFLQINEDGYEYDLVNNIFMIFDGFGGSGVGDQTVTNLKEYIKTFYTRICDDPDATMPFYYSPKYILEGNALINAIVYSHKLLCKNNMASDISKRGGASGLFASLSENIITFASVGNCSCYLNRKGETTQIVSPDNHQFLAQNAYARNRYTMPLSAFGLFDDIHYSITECRPQEGDTYLLVTDGVYGRVEDSEINFLLSKGNMSNQDKISGLFELANKRENLDNQTGLILQF